MVDKLRADRLLFLLERSLFYLKNSPSEQNRYDVSLRAVAVSQMLGDVFEKEAFARYELTWMDVVHGAISRSEEDYRRAYDGR